jgi:glycosyltransferase involved in cell wall biosynthesis
MRWGDIRDGILLVRRWLPEQKADRGGSCGRLEPSLRLTAFPLMTGVYIAVLHVSYVSFVAPTFEYLGMGYRQPALGAYIALVALVCGVAALMPTRLQSPSDMVLWMHFVVATVPTVVVPQFTPFIDTTLALRFGLVVVGSWGLVLLALRFINNRPGTTHQLPKALASVVARVTTPSWIGGLVVLSVLADIWLLLLPGVQLNAVGFADVAQVRLAYREALTAVPTFVPYVLLLATNVVNPALMGYGILRRNRFPLVGLGVAGQLLNYTATGYKTVAISVAVVIVLALWLQRRSIIGWGFLGATVGCMLVALALYKGIGTTSAATFFTTRVLVVPGNVASAVVAYFEDRPPLYWSYSFMSWLLEYPYDRDPSFLIGYTLGGNEATSANTNLFGDGYMNWGYTGVLLECAALVVILVVLDSAAAGVPAALAVPVLAVPAFALSNSSPFTAVLTHGMLAAVAVLAMAPRDHSLYMRAQRGPTMNVKARCRRESRAQESDDRGHVCIVTSAHPYDDVRVGSRIAKALSRAGYRVTWVGPNSSQFKADAPQLDEIDYRLFASSRSRIGRLTAAKKAKRLARQIGRVDWWYSPDPDAAQVIASLARKSGGLTLFDVHESYHGGLLNRWFPGTPPALVRELVRRRIARTCSRMDLVMGVSQAVLMSYITESVNTVVVRNCAPAWFAAGRPAQALEQVGRTSVMHGKVAPGNGSPRVIEAATLLADDVARRVSIQMLEPVGFGGTVFGRQVRQRIQDMPHASIDLRPGVGHEEMADLMARCTIGLISYQRDLGAESLPNRLFEYMAAGLAILAPSYSPEIVAILESERIGIHANFEDPRDIATSLTWLVNHPDEVAAMGRRARAAFLSSYNWDAEAEKLVDKMRSMEP